MNKRHDIQQRSRLGTLLLHKGLISREQLDEALSVQADQRSRLGEVLIRKGWLTEKQLSRALRKQSRYRLIAAISAMLVGPFQPFMASASTVSDDNMQATEQVLQQRNGLKKLSEQDMASVSARGAMENYERLLDVVTNDRASDEETAITTLEGLASSLIPGTNLMDADMELSGVEYEPGPRTTINTDGSLDIQMPSRIREIAFRNIRVAGSEGNHMGDVVLRNVSFGPGTSVKIHLH